MIEWQRDVAAPPLAGALRVMAPALAQRAVARLRAPHRTVVAKILALRCVERFAVALSAGDSAAAARWADRSCERYAGIVPINELLGALVDDVVASLPSSSIAPARVAAAVREVISRPRLVKAARHDAVDEVDVVLDGLLIDLDQADPLTAEHSRAVSFWCARLGERMGASKSEVMHLSRAGLAHDVGKVTTPPEILMAPRRLADDEMEIMRRHAAEGAAIITRVPLLQSLAPAARSHHERIDGTGYPDRLRGEAIPSVARIVAVADAFNAMIGRRPYRPPLAPSVALERLVESRGNQFDPDVVDAMLDIVQHPRTPHA